MNYFCSKKFYCKFALPSLFLSLFLLSSLFFARSVFAVIYQPGETLNPACAPTDTNCRVVAPASGGANSDITSLTGLTTPLPLSEGGIGLSSVPTGGLIYGVGNTTFSVLSIGTSSQLLTVNGSGLPVWATISGVTGYDHWSLQTNGVGTTNILANNTVNFVNGVGVSLVQTGSSVTFNIGQNVDVGASPTFTSLFLTNSSNQITFGTTGSRTILSANTQTADRIVNLPAITANDSLVLNNNSTTLTNKIITAGSNTITGLTTNNLSAGASIANTQLANPNINIITASGSGLQGGGVVGLGGSLSLSFVSVATPGTYGSATQIPVITIDQYGSVTSVTPTTISGLTSSNLSASAGITNTQLSNSTISINPIAGTGISVSGSPVALGGSLNISGINASTTVKGVASFDSANFSVTSGAVNTIQDIGNSASPTFFDQTLSHRLSIGSTVNQLVFGSSNTTTISALSPSSSRTATIPGLTINDIFAFVGQTQTFTSKTIDATNNTISNLTNSNLSGSAGITDANLATISTANKVLGSAVQVNTNGGIGDSGGLTLLRTCTNNQILKWTPGGGWACADDATGGTPSVYSDGGLLSDGGGLSLLRTCADGQLLKWTSASGWHCDADIAGGGSLAVKESDGSPSLSPIVELQFGPTSVSSDEFIISDLGSSMARIRTGNKVVLTDASQTLTNKTISAVGNTITGITNSNLLSGSAAITDNNLSTITTANKVSGSAIQLATGGGLTNNSGLSLLTTCSNGNILAWNSGTSSWGCVTGGSPPISNLLAATASNTINNNNNDQVWNWSLTSDKTAFTFGENTASVGGTGSQYILGVSTRAGSTASPFKVIAQNNTIIDTTPAGGITIGSAAANQTVNILSGTGTINVGTGAFEKTINIGSITGNTALNVLVGTGGYSLNGTGNSSYSIGTSTTTGTFNFGGVSQTGAANFFTGNGGMSINIGTGAGSNVISIGNTSTSTGIHLHTGTGNIHTKTNNGNGVQFLTNTATDDSLRIAAGLNAGAATFEGTITTADLTAARTWTFQNNSGYIPLSTSGNNLFFTTSGSTTLTLPTSGTVTALGNSTTGSGATLVLSTSPTFSTSIFTPLIYGGAIADNTLTLSGNNALSGNTSTLPNITFNVGNSGATTAMTILNNGRVGIGTTSPTGPLEVVMTDNYFQMTRYGDNNFAAGLAGQKARGTQSAPTAVLANDWITGLGAHGYDGVSFPSGVLSASGIYIIAAAENFSSTNKGTYLSMIVTPIGSTTRSEKARLDADGTFRLYNTSNQLSLGSTAALTTISATAPSVNRVATIPGLTIDDTFVFVGQTQTLTSKTIDLPIITGLSVGTGNTGIFIDSSGNLTKRSFGALAFLDSAIAGATNGLSMIGTTTVGLGGTLIQNTNIGTSSFSISFLGLGNSQALFVGTSGYVGIGTTNPSAKLNIIGNVQIGTGSSTTTPSLLTLDKGTTDPTGTNGAMYYNSSTNKFRCYENSAWRNCTGSNTSGVGASFDTITLQTGTTLLGTISITPATAAGDIYIYADLFTNSLSNTDQTVTAEIRSGTTCAGTLLAEGVATLTGGNGTNGPSVLAATLVQNPGATAQNYAICGKTTTAGGVLTRGIVQALVIDTGADLAEIYTTNDSSLTFGDVVSLDSTLQTGIKKSQTAYDGSVLGIISSKPGIVIGDAKPEGVKALPVALSGRVPVKVNTEGGNIKAGDPLTTSSTPGVAMKASKAGSIIGMAMVDYSGQGTGTILAFVQNGQTNGVKTAANLTSTDILANLLNKNSQISTTNLSEIVTDRAIAGLELVTPKITAEDIFATNATFLGTLTVGNLKADNIQGLDTINQKIANLQAQISTFSAVLSIQDLEASGTAKFQNTVEFHGPVIFKNMAEFIDTVVFRNRVQFADKDMGGVAIIKQSTSEVEIKFEKPYEQVPIVNISLVYEGTDEPTFIENGKKATVAYLNRDGFKIILSDLAARDFKYHWIALMVKDAKTFTAEPVSTPTPTPAPTSIPTPIISPTPTIIEIPISTSSASLITPIPTP